MKINELRTKQTNLEKIELNWHLKQRKSLSQSDLTEMHCISYGAHEHDMHTDLCFEVKQIQFAQEFHDKIWRKTVLLQAQNMTYCHKYE